MKNGLSFVQNDHSYETFVGVNKVWRTRTVLGLGGGLVKKKNHDDA